MQRMHWTDGLLLVLVCLLWGSSYPIIKIALRGVPPFTLAGLELGGATVFLAALAAGLRLPLRLTPGHVVPLVLLGLFQNALFLVSINLSMRSIAAGLTTVLTYSYPMLVAVAAWIVLREPLGRVRVLGLILGFAGVAVASLESVLGKMAVDGVLWALAAAASWTTASIILKRWLTSLHPLVVTTWQSACATLLLLPAIGYWDSGQALAATPVIWVAVLWLAVLPGGVAYLIWFRVLARNSTAATGSYMFLGPVFSVLVSRWLLQEALTPPLLIAMVCVAASIYLVARGSFQRMSVAPASGGGD